MRFKPGISGFFGRVKPVVDREQILLAFRL